MNKSQSHDMPPGTILESDEDVRRVQAEIRERIASATNPERDDRTVDTTEQPFRPISRPASAALTVYDDGAATGELVRLRHDRFVVGRSEGDLQFPDDEQISKRHIALSRQLVSGEFRWVITDLQSRNGLFVRVNKAPLNHLSEVLIGGGRYRLEIVQQAVAETTGFGNYAMAPHTKVLQGEVPVGTETLSELIQGGVGTRLVLMRDEYVIGKDPSCEISRPHDPFTKGRHAKLSRSPKGTWVIQNLQSLNGVWLRLPQITIRAGECCEFQIGEQRMKLRFGR